MDTKELEVKLAEVIKENLEEVKKQIAAVEALAKDSNNIEEVKAVKAELTKSVETMQTQLDELATQVKKNKTTGNEGKDPIKALLKEHFALISKVDKSAPFSIVVKDMTLPVNLVGDQPRDYNNNPVLRPAQKVNVQDLARTIPIQNGTYTYVQSVLTSGAVATQTEGALKAELVYTYTMVDANTDYIAGISIYSKKMRNNLSWMEATLGEDLRRDYYKGENAAFQAILAAQATASTEIITGNTLAGMLVNDMAKLEDLDFMPNAIVVRPSDWYTILKTPKDDLEAVVTFEGSTLRLNGTPVVKATWIPANKYYVGEWDRVSKIVTEGLSFEVSEYDGDNFSKNNITAKIEAQVTLAVEQPDALVYGDFTSA